MKHFKSIDTDTRCPHCSWYWISYGYQSWLGRWLGRHERQQICAGRQSTATSVSHDVKFDSHSTMKNLQRDTNTTNTTYAKWTSSTKFVR